MRRKEIKKAIEKLGPWYQRYAMDKTLYTTKETISGEETWPVIRELLADDLYGLKVLDVGASAAYYSVLLALEGSEVTAIEPDPIYFKQAQWTKHYFEESRKEKLSIKLYKKTASEIDYSDLSYFDYILALSVIHHIGEEFGGLYSDASMLEQKRVISEWCKVTDHVVVETANDQLKNSIGHYNAIFLENDLYMLKKIMGEKTYLLYGRLVKNGDYGW